ncbi:MAG: radical SAM protein [Candidatus Desulfatibia sp.]|uniref:radical SAM protein n=1 Tax=Candidatus Desulfatibia sp. TaxID=3101189 RepID=UPI002F336AAB
MKKSSPEYLQLSLAAAMTLGLKKGKFFRNARLYCLNLLLTYPEGCRASCTYCGLARPESAAATEDGHEKKASSFIRVEWPIFPTDRIIEMAGDNKTLERACISTLTHPNNKMDTLAILKKLKEKTKLPVSILSNPTTTSIEDIKKLKDSGADRFTVAIDLATAELFEAHRGKETKGPHKWDRYWESLEEAQKVFGRGNIGSHLIVGMGETEKEMAAAIQRVFDLGGTTHLFSFYPEPGSRMEKAKSCDPAQYRRVQLARYMIDKGITSYGTMEFDQAGRIVSYGAEHEKSEFVIESGKPFQTSGCPGKDCGETACNRPFGDGPPSDIRSYPFELEKEDIARVRRQMDDQMDEIFLPEKLTSIEQLNGVKLDRVVWEKALAARPNGNHKIVLNLPSFKQYSTSELSNACSNKSFPAVSITGGECMLRCEHCRGKLLEPMIPATTPTDLLETAASLASQNAEGILISGGSDRGNRIPFKDFLWAIEKIKNTYDLRIAVHTGLIDSRDARGLSDAGVDTAMIDVIGSDETISHIYHLDKSVEDFEASLENLCSTSMKVAPHIVLGLHYGKMLGEWKALEIVARHSAETLIVVVAMPYYAKDPSKFPAPPAEEVGKFLAECRRKLPEKEIALGCARPGGEYRQRTDLYALAAGVDGIAFPADGTLEAAGKLGLKAEVSYACCSMSKFGVPLG